MIDLQTLLIDVCQVFDGWHQDGTAWTEWDESVRKRVSQALKEMSNEQDKPVEDSGKEGS